MKHILTLLCALILHLAPTHATQIISSFTEAKELLETLDEESLVIFDVDGVLIECQDPILRLANRHHLHALMNQHTGDLPKEHLDELISIIYLQAKRFLIEEEVVSIIQSLHERKIAVIALTATRIGKIGRLDSVQSWRIDDLRSKNIAFTPFPDCTINRLSYMGPSPIAKEGILISGNYPKGLVLRSWLDQMGIKPATVVFFDDIPENITSVERHMRAIQIQNLHLFLYRGADKHQELPDLEQAQVQIKQLTIDKVWQSP